MSENLQGEFAVVIPTWRRPEALVVCLRALSRQTFLPARVLVVHKADDRPTIDLLSESHVVWAPLPVQAVEVSPDGNFLTQLNAGIAATSESLVAITDDDAEPWPDWLERLSEHFADPKVGGVGGRDWQAHERGDRLVVGRISWFGRVTGNHHLGAGPPRDVDLLKGVNWAFRGDLLRTIGVDPRLRGTGTVMNTEMSVCFAIRRRGWRLVYDPAAAVDHHVAPRADDDVNSRGRLAAGSFTDTVHNETLAMLDHLSPLGRAAFAVWAAVAGTSAAPGVGQVVRLAWRRSPQLWVRWRATMAGRWAAWRTHRSGRALPPANQIDR